MPEQPQLPDNIEEIIEQSANEELNSAPDNPILAKEAEREWNDEERDRYKSDTKDRKWLAEWSSTIVSLWMFIVICIVINNHRYAKLSDSVLITLLTTTTVNVLGLMYIVLRGHFGNSSNKG